MWSRTGRSKSVVMAALLKSYNYLWPHWTTDTLTDGFLFQNKAQNVSIMSEILTSMTALH